MRNRPMAILIGLHEVQIEMLPDDILMVFQLSICLKCVAS